MSSWISKDGVWSPQTERVGLTNYGPAFKHPITGQMIEPGDPFTYEGPDRRALFELWEQDNTGATKTLGQKFTRSPEFLQMMRELNFKSAEEYFSYVGYDPKVAEEKFKALEKTVNKHELPAKKKEIKRLGGGRDTVGDDNKWGGFGEPRDVSLPK